MEILLDSNIVIYLEQGITSEIINYMQKKELVVSEITIVEVLGFHKITKHEIKFFETFFQEVKKIAINNKVIRKAVELRQKRKMSLGDALIAASALVYNMPLITQNIDDFMNIENLQVKNLF